MQEQRESEIHAQAGGCRSGRPLSAAGRQMRLLERRLAAVRLAARVRKPLLTVATVAAEVGADCGWHHVMRAVEEGRIVWAWRINAAHSTRNEVRILRHSARHYARTLGARPEPELSWDEVLAVALPEGEAIPCTRLMCWWSAAAELGQVLMAEGSLSSVAGTANRRGPGGSRLVTRASAIEFLKSRRIA